ncbi:MAG TPA: hypothetical protein VEU08_03350, partial [Vicinamibacterales bacterium]|nr:hypothetical protein [Vicinamibacterales bacterium]
MSIKRSGLAAALLVVCAAAGAAAQDPTGGPGSTDTRTQYPSFLANSYFTFDVGRIGYLFTEAQLEPGFTAQSVDIPHLAARVDFFGHHITKNLTATVTYIRPAQFIKYNNINGNQQTSQVSMAYAGLTLGYEFPLSSQVGGYLEAGWGATSRSGVEIDKQTAVQTAHFAAVLAGGGLAIHTTANTDLMLSAMYSPGRKAFDQPSTRLFTAGIRYHMRPLPEDRVEEARNSGYAFPENVLRVGLTTNIFSYGPNDFFSRTVPIFWGGNVETRQGVTLDYQRNVFHTAKVFAFDLGGSASYWQSNGNEDAFQTVSFYPMFRFFVHRGDESDFYFNY